MTVKKVLIVFFLLIFAEMVTVGCTKNAVANEFNVERKAELNTISPFDNLLKAAADSTQWDWELLAAIAHQESRFRTDVRSRSGALGLMQIMPRTARGFGVQVSELTDAQTNIAVAVQLLDRISTTFRFPASMPQSEKLKVILASYNAGPGHILDARRLAAAHGEAYNSWSTLRKYVLLKGDYTDHEAVRCGDFNGTETVDFVDKVFTKYTQYKRLTSNLS